MSTRYMDFATSVALTTILVASLASPVSTLPEDVMILIFFRITGHFPSEPREYDTSRRRLRQINRRWMDVVDAYPLAWTQVYASFATHVTSFRDALRKSRRLEIDVVLDLTDTDFATKNNWSKKDIQDYVDVLFTVLDESWSRYRSLIVRTTSCVATPALVRHITALRSRTLRTLVVQLDPHYFTPAYRRPAPLFDNSGLKRILELPAIQTLDMHSLVPGWIASSPYARLTHLILRHIFISPTELADIFHETQLLVTLELHDIEFNGNIFQAIPPMPPLPLLTRLVLDTSGYTANSVSSKLVLPALHTMVLNCRNCPALWDESAREDSYLQRVKNVTVSLDVNDKVGLVSFLERMRGMIEMVVSSSDETTFGFLRELSTSRNPWVHQPSALCPELKKLTFKGKVTNTGIDDILLERPLWMFHGDFSVSCGSPLKEYRVVDGKVCEVGSTVAVLDLADI